MKRIAFLFLVLSAAISLHAAVDLDFVVGQNTGASLNFNQSSETSSVRSQFLFNIDAELDMDFGKGHGMLIVVNPFSEGGSVEFRLDFGYAYQMDISHNIGFIAGVGPSFIFGSGGTSLGLFVTADFDVDITDDLFIRLGTGLKFNIGRFGDRDFGKLLDLVIPLPAIGIGWSF